MLVRVSSIVPQGTVAVASGEEVEGVYPDYEPTGKSVTFGGDWRPLSHLTEVLEQGREVIVEVEDWQVLGS